MKPLSKLSTSGKSSLAVNAISNWVSLGVEIAVGFFVTPIVIGTLGTTYYGIWTLMSNVLGYYGLLDLGISSAIVRYAARYAGLNDHHSLNRVANTAMIVFTFIGFLVFVLSFVLAEVVVRFFNINPADWLMVKHCILWTLTGEAPMRPTVFLRK